MAHREDHRREELELGRVVRGVRRRVPEPLRGAAGGLAAVVAVGDVEVLHVAEGVDEALGALDLPERVSDAVLGLEVVERIPLLHALHPVVDGLRVPVREHHRLGVRLLGEDVPGPVVLLLGPGLLVLDDGAVVVLGDRRAGEHARLLPPVHDEPVHVHGRRVLLQGVVRVHEPTQVLGPLLVDRVVVDVGLRRKVNFGPDHVQEAAGLVLGQRPRFLGIDHVVGHRRNLLDVLRPRPYGAKGVQ